MAAAKGQGPRVAILGAGLSGIGMGIAMSREGMDDFTVFEKASRVGGTWHYNRYPGLTCDVPSRFYQYSFALSPEWSHLFSPGAEIRNYVEDVATEYGVIPHVRLETEVTETRWEDGRWKLTCADGKTDEADVVVAATGVLHQPLVPDFPGLDSFEGNAFHSSEWDDDAVLDGKRVAVIGTGSTGVQIVSALAGRSAGVRVFQRSRHWVMKLPNPRYGEGWKKVMRRIPFLSRLAYHFYRAALFDGLAQATVKPGPRRTIWQAIVRLNHRVLIRDPELRRKLTPDYPPLCKRLISSPTWFRALQDPTVEVIDCGIERIEQTGIRDREGRLHEVDVIVMATGFDAQAFMRPMNIIGPDGITLDEAWANGPRAYETVALPGFPNLFTIQGPHGPVGNYSLLAYGETQINWIMYWLKLMRDGRVATVTPDEAITDAYYARMREAIPDTVWTTGCRSWYHGPDGQPDIWPWTARRHREMLSEHRPSDFHIEYPAA